MPRAGLTAEALVDLAIDLIDEAGPGALTLAAVAKRAGVATPSLYNHLNGLEDLRRLVTIRVFGQLRDALAKAADGERHGAVARVMHAYRDYVIRHPARYAALPQTPQPDPAISAVANQVVGLIMEALHEFDLDAAATIHATRCVRAAVHGFAALQTGGAFGLPEEVDTTYRLLVDVLVAGLPQLSAAPVDTDPAVSAVNDRPASAPG